MTTSAASPSPSSSVPSSGRSFSRSSAGVSRLPSPQRLLDALRDARELIAALPEDERLRIDTIEGETQLWELLDCYAEAALADKALIDKARERLERLERRAERAQSIVRRILDSVGLTRMERPLYTAFTTFRSKPIVTDADELPASFMRTAPDMIAIGKTLRAGETVPGATLSNPEPSLTLSVR